MFSSKILTPLLLSLFLSLPAWSAPSSSSDVPRGRFAELHSCELFAGSCVVSSEADLAGNYVLRVWTFEQGAFQRVPLQGLTLALLEKGGENLAVLKNGADKAVAYLPPGISPAQRDALLAWARQSTAAKLDDAHVKIAPLQSDFTPDKVSFSAGKDITFSGGTPAVCEVGGCGEMLWYDPRSPASSFAVDQLGQSRIIEPLLSVQWMDHGRRTLFVGRFGDPEVTVPPLCGAPTQSTPGVVLGRN